jgi:cellulose synthase/poly-beta-1,6-N-acetylglucosamine synthase-like glycosyltransferase
MKDKNKLTISVGTAAFNEEQNIVNMLKTVVSQKEKTIKIVEIIVVSDGSNDRTIELAKSIKDNRIKVLDDGKRLGQPSRIGQLLKVFKGDVLVLIDSDMILRGEKALEKMVSKFQKDRKLALVCGDTLPLPARTFLESAINNYIYARRSLRNGFGFGSTAYCAHAFLAYSKKFGKSLNIPKDVLNADAFSYFSCRTNGYKVYFAEEAIALYRSPASIKDYINQATRHIAGGLQLYKYFGQKTVDAGFALPKNVLTKLMVLQLKKNPAGYVVLKILNFYCRYKSRKNSNFDPKWATIKSSKKLLGDPSQALPDQDDMRSVI